MDSQVQELGRRHRATSNAHVNDYFSVVNSFASDKVEVLVIL